MIFNILRTSTCWSADEIYLQFPQLTLTSTTYVHSTYRFLNLYINYFCWDLKPQTSVRFDSSPSKLIQSDLASWWFRSVPLKSCAHKLNFRYPLEANLLWSLSAESFVKLQKTEKEPFSMNPVPGGNMLFFINIRYRIFLKIVLQLRCWHYLFYTL